MQQLSFTPIIVQDSSEEYLKWWSTNPRNELYERPPPTVAGITAPDKHHGLRPLKPVREKHRCSKVQQQRLPVKGTQSYPLRKIKLANLDNMLKKEFYSSADCFECEPSDIPNCHGSWNPFRSEHDNFNIRFSLPQVAKRGKAANAKPVKERRKRPHRPPDRADAVHFAPDQATNQVDGDDQDRKPAADPFFGWSDERLNKAFYEAR
mmetsp:Transcript_970/g.1452  ORF Transcript_970/g.1452 Transcript_970/m.1452 type:complete len:207 (-) Transcript_970:1117-1737(-)